MRVFLAIGWLLCLMSFVICGEQEAPDSGLTEFDGDIEKSTILEAGHYVVKNVLSVPRDVGLRVKPGTYLKLEKGLKIEGTLVAVGTKESPIFIEFGVPSNSYIGREVASKPKVLFKYCRFKDCNLTCSQKEVSFYNCAFANIVRLRAGQASFVNCIFTGFQGVGLLLTSNQVKIQDVVINNCDVRVTMPMELKTVRLDMVNSRFIAKYKISEGEIFGVSFSGDYSEEMFVEDGDDDARYGRLYVKSASKPHNPRMIEVASRFEFKPPVAKQEGEQN